jgi:hypothetical protein
MGSVHSSFGDYDNANNYQNSLKENKDNNKLDFNFENASA